MSTPSSTDPIREFFDSLAPTWDDDNEIDPRMDSWLDQIGIQPGSKVLDLACGTGVITGLLSKRSQAEVVGLDLSPKMIDMAKKKYEGNPNVSFLCGDFYRYVPDHSYHFIVLFNAYPHFIDRDELREAFKRNLGPKGRFAILHSLGREQLNHHHEGCACEVSRGLSPVEEEWAYFQKDFQPILLEENESHYFIIGQKK